MTTVNLSRMDSYATFMGLLKQPLEFLPNTRPNHLGDMAFSTPQWRSVTPGDMDCLRLQISGGSPLQAVTYQVPRRERAILLNKIASEIGLPFCGGSVRTDVGLDGNP